MLNPLKNKNGLGSPFMVEMRGFVAEGVIEERVSSLTKAKRQPWLDRGSATQLRTTRLCKSPHIFDINKKDKQVLPACLFMVEMRGFEPLAYALRTHCSTN